ncbi:MAG: discoidin domain-containing protein, partial [Bacteroidales bacterium]
GRGVPLILNIPPDRNGVFAEPYVAVLRKYKEYLDTTFGNDLIPSTAVASATQVRADDESFSAAKVLDDNYDTYWTMNDGQTTGTITVDFGEEKRFDIVQFQEYVPLGQRVSGWRVDVNVNGKWQEFGTGTTIGFKRIFKGKEVQASGVRLAITGSLAVPLINALAVYRSHKDLIDSDLPPIVGTDGQFSVAADYMTAHETDASVTVKILLKSRSEKPVNVYVATLPGTGVQGKV